MRRPKTREELETEANSAVLLVMNQVHGNKRDRSIPIPDYDNIFAIIERGEPFTITRLCANLSISKASASAIFGKGNLTSKSFPSSLKSTFNLARTYSFSTPETPWREHWLTKKQAESIYRLCTGWSTHHIGQAIRDKNLPAYRLSTNCLRLLRKDLVEFISARISAHNARQPVGHKKAMLHIPSAEEISQ